MTKAWWSGSDPIAFLCIPLHLDLPLANIAEAGAVLLKVCLGGKAPHGC